MPVVDLHIPWSFQSWNVPKSPEVLLSPQFVCNTLLQMYA